MENLENLGILVIEDNPKHLEDVKVTSQEIGVNPVYASTLEEAKAVYENQQLDGIVSDVFFPVSEGDAESPSCYEVCDYAEQNNVPLVLCTSTYHHGAKTEPVNQFANKNSIPIIDAPYEIGEGEAESKKWPEAIYSLLALIKTNKGSYEGRAPDILDQINEETGWDDQLIRGAYKGISKFT